MEQCSALQNNTKISHIQFIILPLVHGHISFVSTLKHLLHTFNAVPSVAPVFSLFSLLCFIYYFHLALIDAEHAVN